MFFYQMLFNLLFMMQLTTGREREQEIKYRCSLTQEHNFHFSNVGAYLFYLAKKERYKERKKGNKQNLFLSCLSRANHLRGTQQIFVHCLNNCFG